MKGGCECHAKPAPLRDCEDRVQEGPASGRKGSKGRNQLGCIRGEKRDSPPGTSDTWPPTGSPEYRGTSLIGNTPLPGPYSRTIPTVLRGSWGGKLFLMSEVSLK